MEELQDLIFEAWEKVERKIAEDPSELGRRLEMRRRAGFRRPIRPWCLVIRASDRRISEWFGWRANWQGWEGRQEIDVSERLVRKLTMPVKTDRPYSTEREMGYKLGRSRKTMWAMSKSGIFARRNIHLLGGLKGHVPVIYSEKLLDPCANKLAFPHWAWATQHAWLCERVPVDFEQTIERVPVYRESLLPRPLTGPRQRPRDPFSRNWTKDGQYIPDKWELKRDHINARVRERYRENRMEKLALGTLRSKVVHNLIGWRWICPKCQREAGQLYLPLFAVKAWRLLGERDPAIGSEMGMPKFEERFLCYRCHDIQYVPSYRKRVAWNYLIMHASGGLLFGREVRRPEWFARETSAWRNRITVRREEVQRRLLLGERVKEIAAAIGETATMTYQDAHRIYRSAGVRNHREYLRAVGLGERALTKRERVKQLMGEGLSSREIAERLGLTMKAVNLHRFQLYRLAGVHSRGEWMGKCAGIAG